MLFSDLALQFFILVEIKGKKGCANNHIEKRERLMIFAQIDKNAFV